MADIVAQCKAPRNASLSAVLMTLVSKHGAPKQGDQTVARSRSFLLASQELDREAARIKVSGERDSPASFNNVQEKLRIENRHKQARESEINNPSDRGEEVCELRQRLLFERATASASKQVTYCIASSRPKIPQQAPSVLVYSA